MFILCIAGNPALLHGHIKFIIINAFTFTLDLCDKHYYTLEILFQFHDYNLQQIFQHYTAILLFKASPSLLLSHLQTLMALIQVSI